MQPDSLWGKAAAKAALMLHHKMTTRCGEGDVTEEKCKLWCCVYGGAVPQLFYCLELYEVHRWDGRKEFRVDLASRWAFPAESGIFQLDGGIFEQIKPFVHKSPDLHLHRRVPLKILWFTVNNFNSANLLTSQYTGINNDASGGYLSEKQKVTEWNACSVWTDESWESRFPCGY